MIIVLVILGIISLAVVLPCVILSGKISQQEEKREGK